MYKTKKISILIIIVSAVLVALLFNYRPLFFLLEQLETKSFSEIDNRVMMRIYVGIFSFVFHIILFCIVAFFNYSWKDKLIPPGIPKTGRILLIITGNIIIFYLLAFSESVSVKMYDARINLTTGYFLFANISIAGAAAAEAYFFILLRKIKTAEIENVQLKEERAKAELAILKEQISPHFLFNTLNSLSSVIRNEKKSESLDFVENMSEVYRYILDSESNDTVTISEELEFLEAYIYLLKKRFGNNLQIEINIDEQQKKHKIPPMALQILVENVVKHNILSSMDPIFFCVDIREDYLYAQNGINKKKEKNGHGVGLANLNKRCKMIAGREIEIKESPEQFQVKLPIIMF